MKNKLMRAATLLMVLTLMTSCFVGSTFAKYTSSASGSDTARVAKWSFTVEGTDIATADTVSFDLFNTIRDTGMGENDADVDDAANSDEGTTQIIAPGTSGSFEINVTNDAEVTAEYDLTLSLVTSKDATDNSYIIPLQFSRDGTSDWKDDISALNITNEKVITAQAANATSSPDDSNSAVHTVYWRWVFDKDAAGEGFATQTNANDTALGVAAYAGTHIPSVTVTVNFVAEQVD